MDDHTDQAQLIQWYKKSGYEWVNHTKEEMIKRRL